MKVLIIHPGAMWSTSDVESGLRFGLEHHGVEVVQYRLDSRLANAKSWLYFNWRKAKKQHPDIPKPTSDDILYQAGRDALATALHHNVTAVIVVSGRLLHPNVLVLMKRAGLRVIALFTESPYDIEYESSVAKMIDGCWTNERSSVEELRAVNPNAGYLPHGWHPKRHFVGVGAARTDLPAHDVVFVGSGFPERVTWFNAIDWTGIDLGLYGTWEGLGLKPQVEACIRGATVDNAVTAALYSRAKIGLNLYRTSKAFSLDPGNQRRITHAESLSPRAYELAACGAFHLSEYRAEVPEVFGDLVPTFTTPTEASVLIRRWLADDAGRADVAQRLPAVVADMSWVERATRVIGDVQSLLAQPARSAA